MRKAFALLSIVEDIWYLIINSEYYAWLQQIFYQHTEGVSQKSLSRDFKLGKATIERWYHQIYIMENRELSYRLCPQILGIDEHSFIIYKATPHEELT